MIRKNFGSSGSGTTIDTLAVMNSTTGTDGQLFWNTDYHALFAWTVDRWDCIYVDPRYGFILYEEFAGADRIGQLDWSGNNGQLAGTALAPGLVTVSNSAASSIQRMSGQLNAILLGTLDMNIEWGLRIPTLSNGTDNCTFIWGLNDGSSYDSHGACTDGAYFSLDYAIDTTHLNTNTSSNGSNTQKTSVLASAVPVAGTFLRSNILVTGSTSVGFYVAANPYGGTPITTAHSTNIPTAAGRQTGLNLAAHKVLGTGAQSIDPDYVKVCGFFKQARAA